MLAGNAALGAALEQGDANGPAGVLRLAWGLLLGQSGPESAYGTPLPPPCHRNRKRTFPTWPSSLQRSSMLAQ